MTPPRTRPESLNWIQNLSAAVPAEALQPGAAGTSPGTSASSASGPAWPRLDELTLTELVLPEQANHYGTLFGPNALALMGKAAFLVATRYTRQSIVMAAAQGIEFLRPVPVGAVIKLSARVVRTGRSSLTARVLVCLDAAPGVAPEPVLRGDFEMVAVDAHGRPTALTPVQAAQPLGFAAP